MVSGSWLMAQGWLGAWPRAQAAAGEDGWAPSRGGSMFDEPLLEKLFENVSVCFRER